MEFAYCQTAVGEKEEVLSVFYKIWEVQQGWRKMSLCSRSIQNCSLYKVSEGFMFKCQLQIDSWGLPYDKWSSFDSVGALDFGAFIGYIWSLHVYCQSPLQVIPERMPDCSYFLQGALCQFLLLFYLFLGNCRLAFWNISWQVYATIRIVHTDM